MDQGDLLDHISRRARETGHPLVIGISGYCGSGKSTLARELVAELPEAMRIRGDDFLDPVRSHGRSTDWDGVDRQRLATTVLVPFRDEQTSEFRRYDWTARALGAAEPLPHATILVVDLIGLSHPDTLPFMDVAIWCDIDLHTAATRGMARDAELGRDHEALWRDVWLPNEIDFAARFTPRASASVICKASR
ncbi:phosphoglycerate transporter [Clavibacter michiganensis]|uniref:uridine kinase family protein n=1 Tax=Clavibacter michiganensis TaxID=28447 RepID=UPI000CE791E3|nr:phosphoglycerate transporter [Clavibacter michiganensis]PPF50022.1 phosphoglycerate transporter [Clavibacter michiganensis]